MGSDCGSAQPNGGLHEHRVAVVVDGDRDGEPVLVEGLRAKVPLSGGSPDRDGKGAIPDRGSRSLIGRSGKFTHFIFFHEFEQNFLAKI